MATTRTENKDKTVLVLGITGGYGLAMARELGGRGYALRALVRDRARAAAAVARVGAPVALVEGDVLDREALAGAAAGADVIVHGVNAPYHRWDPFVLQAAAAIADVAAAQGATLLFPGNVYAYAPGVGITEAAPLAPPTRKGRLRVAVEATLTAATTRGVRLILLRGGDFFGLGGGSTWMGQVLGKAVKGGAIVYPTDLSVRHQWAFLPDFARAHADLLERADGLPAAASFHFAGHVATGAELVEAARAALGDPARRVSRLPWGLLRVLSVASPMLREVVKMRYLWDHEVLMDGGRLAAVIGPSAQTPLGVALAVEIAARGGAAAADARAASEAGLGAALP